MFSMGYFYNNNMVLLCNFVGVCWLGDLIDIWVSHKLCPVFRILENKGYAAVEAFPQQTPASSHRLTTSFSRKHWEQPSHSLTPTHHLSQWCFPYSSETPTETALVRLAGLCLCLYFERVLATALFLLTDPHRPWAGRPTGTFSFSLSLSLSVWHICSTFT